MKKTLIAVIFLTACATTKPAPAPCNPGLALVNAAAWLQTSAEYRAIATQTYKEWAQWVSEAAATPVPGAAEYARSRGVTPFYITNRLAAEEAVKRRNLETLGFPLDPNEDTILTRGERPEWSAGDKTPRRDSVASRYRVLLTFGDDLNDFVPAQGKTMDERFDLIRANAAKWGHTWFMLPNPAYGSREVTAAGSGTACEQLRRKIETLK